MRDIKRKFTIYEAFEVLAQLDNVSGSIPIEHLQINRKTVDKLKKHNIHSLLELIQSAKIYYRGELLSNSQKLLHRFWSGIEYDMEDKFCQLAHAESSGKIDWVLFWEAIGYEFTFAAAKLDDIFDFDDETKALSIDSINIGEAVFLLKDDGIQTVGDLVPRLSAGLPDYRGFGREKLWIFACGLREFIGTINDEGTTSSLSIMPKPLLTTPGGCRTLQYRAKNRSIKAVGTRLSCGQKREKRQPTMHDIETRFTIYEALEQMDYSSTSTPIEHLQIRKQTVDKLKEHDIDSLQKLVQFAKKYHGGDLLSNGEKHLHRFWSDIEHVMEDKFRQLAHAGSSGRIDWVLFWETIDYEFTFAAAKLDEIFNFDDETKALSIDSLNIGKAVFSLKDDGIQTVGDLLPRLSAGLPDYRGFGKNKLWVFACGLREFIGTMNSEGTSSLTRIQEFPPTTPGYRGTLQYRAKNWAKMSEDTKKLSLGQIHLHNEIDNLQSIGVENLDQLLELFDKGVPQIKGVGKMARIRLYSAVKSADLATEDSGKINWNTFAFLSGMAVYPGPEIPLNSGEDFLSSLDGVVTSLTTQCFDEIESATLIHRLIPAKKGTATLESISRNFAVTRERIRQKQEIILKALSSSLIDNEYVGISFRFSEQFSTYWQDAARHFGSNQTLSYFEFIAGLSEVWAVEEARIRAHLPLIYSILTKNSTLPPEFVASSFLPAEVFHIKHGSDLNRPFPALHPSRNLARNAEKVGVTRLGQLLTMLRSGSAPFSRRVLESLFNEILSPLSKAVSPSGAVNWEKYYELKEITILPVKDSSSPNDFVEFAVETVAEFIRGTYITGRSEPIFIHRIIPNAENRKTLNQTGGLLGCAPPSIKKEETELLERLHDAIFGSDYTSSSVHFRDSFIQKWNKSKSVSQQAKSIPYFAELLGLEWDLDKTSIMQVVPMIASVIKGRPLGYTGKKYSLDSNKKPATAAAPGYHPGKTESASVIRLRGFRYIH